MSRPTHVDDEGRDVWVGLEGPAGVPLDEDFLIVNYQFVFEHERHVLAVELGEGHRARAYMARRFMNRVRMHRDAPVGELGDEQASVPAPDVALRRRRQLVMKAVEGHNRSRLAKPVRGKI